MTRKDFVALAKLIKESALDTDSKVSWAEAVAAKCAASNDRFDYDRFYTACGLPELCEVDE